MLHFLTLTPKPSFLLPLLLLLFLSYAVSSHPIHLSLPDENGETNNGSITLVLAPHRTNRPDIFNHFKRYTCGWNLTSYHYLSSVVSSAVPLIIAALAWLLIFGICLQLICCCYCSCPSPTTPPPHAHAYSKSAYVSSLIFLILFTIAAIGGCLILYSGQGKLHKSTSQTLHFLVNQAHLTAQNLRGVSDYFDTTKQAGLAADLSFLPPNFGQQIDHVKTKINDAALLLSNKTDHNSHNIQHGLDTMRLALIIVAAVMLSLAFLGFLCSLLGIQCLIYSLVVVAWILVACTFILSGGFLFLHNVIGDTCVAMDEWVQHPSAHTALDEILPCVDTSTAQETLQGSKVVIAQIVDAIDLFISKALNPHQPFIPFNQSGPQIPLLCNPFQSCSSATKVTLQNANKVWKNYICEVSSSSSESLCAGVGRMTPTIYTQLAALVNVTYGLYHYGPFLSDLVDCTFVRETFSAITHNYCPSLSLFTKWIYLGLVVLSVAVMLSLILWIIYYREHRHRLYTKKMSHINVVT
ncbi:hypothetical protein PIB30_062256 [Stylosanthes scabra]|uniref:Uncharacterized protein n=1 Tax=Stylosanthes scabra TaxID=79078 RepID=A0ABU6XKX4_9FABA|nr:hypothetical protein [Stylosanthes scabra]